MRTPGFKRKTLIGMMFASIIVYPFKHGYKSHMRVWILKLLCNDKIFGYWYIVPINKF